MEHVVRFRSGDGEERWEPAPSLEAAVARVERLHNDGAANDVRVFREVPLEVRTVVRVSVAVPTNQGPPADESARPAPPAEAVAPPEPPVVVHAEPVAPPGATPLTPSFVARRG